MRISLLGLAISWSGCAPPQPTSVEATPEAPTRTFRVDLPRTIDLDSLIPPLQHADGIYRVDGLLMRPIKQFDQEIVVTGYVVEKSMTERQCRRAKLKEKCPKPHFWIADTAGQTQEKLRVVDLKRKKMGKIKLNKKYKVTGIFTQTSKSGFVNSDGLLLFKKKKK